MGSVIYTAEHPGKSDAEGRQSCAGDHRRGGQGQGADQPPDDGEAFYRPPHPGAGDGVVLGSRTFTAKDPEAVSTYELPKGYSGVLLATSFCNLHDFWLTETKI